MGVSHDATVSVAGTATASLSVSLTVANNLNRYLVCSVGVRNATNAVPSSVTFNTSENFVQQRTQVSTNDSAIRLTILTLDDPTVTTADVVCTLAASYSAATMIVTSLYNTDPTTALADTGINSLSSGGSGIANDAQMTASTGDGSLYPTGALAYGVVLMDVDGAQVETFTARVDTPYIFSYGALTATAAAVTVAPAFGVDPDDPKNGDVCVAMITTENNASHSCATSGWNFLVQNNGTSLTQSLWWARKTSVALSVPTVTWTGSADVSARIFEFKNCRLTDPPVALIGTFGSGTTTTHTSTGGNTIANDSLVAYFDTCNANTALGTPAGWTEFVDSGSATGPYRTTVGSKAMTTSGSASGNISVTGGGTSWIQQQVEFLSDGKTQVDLTTSTTKNVSNLTNLLAGYEPADTYNAIGWAFTATGGNDGAAAWLVINPRFVAASVATFAVTTSNVDGFVTPLAKLMDDRVFETTATTGTGTVTLDGAATGYITFASRIAVGAPVYYCITHQSSTEWEVGLGTLVTGTTISRDVVFSSSNSDALVSFSSGTKDVFTTAPAKLLNSLASSSGPAVWFGSP